MDTTARCPQCQAAAPQDATWCSLCFADLRPEAPASPGASAGSSVEASDPSSSEAPDGAPDGKPVGDGEDSATTPTTRADAERRAEQMLAELAVQTPRLSLPGPFSTTAGRVSVMLGGVVVLSALTLGLLQGAGTILP